MGNTMKTFINTSEQRQASTAPSRYRGVWLMVAAAFALSACAGAPRTVEYDDSVDFSRYQTFAWASPERRDVKDPVLDSELLDRRVANAIRQALSERGMEEAPAEEADLLITYHTTSRQQFRAPHVRVHLSYGPGYPYYPHWYAAPHYRGPYYHYDQRSYQEGTLIIDVVDRERNELVWRGWRAGEVRAARFRDGQLQQQIDRILNHFPPPS